LQSLRIGTHTTITDEELSSLKELRNLRSLSLKLIFALKGTCLDELCESLCGTLQELELSSCPDIETLVGIDHLVNLTRLSLNLDRSSATKTKCFDTSAQTRFPHLDHFDICNINSLHSLLFLSNSPQLDSLGFANCHEILSEELNDDNVTAALGNNLTSLYLHNCRMVASRVFLAIGKMTRLKALSIDNCAFDDNDIIDDDSVPPESWKVLGPNESLINISLSGNTNFKSLNFLKYCTKLQSLRLRQFPAVTSLSDVIDFNRLKNITLLGLEDFCSTLPEEDFNKIFGLFEGCDAMNLGMIGIETNFLNFDPSKTLSSFLVRKCPKLEHCYANIQQLTTAFFTDELLNKPTLKTLRCAKREFEKYEEYVRKRNRE
jgi:hypothetical protein